MVVAKLYDYLFTLRAFAFSWIGEPQNIPSSMQIPSEVINNRRPWSFACIVIKDFFTEIKRQKKRGTNEIS